MVLTKHPGMHILLVASLMLMLACEQPAPPPLGARYAEAYLARQAITEQPPSTLDDAVVVQADMVAALQADLGVVVGYKAGLTTAAAQETFGVTHPIRGVLLEAMLRLSGATVAADFGTRPMFEGDLLVRVVSEAINEAETDEDLLAGLDAVIPFLELPDLTYDTSITLNGAALTAINAGARLGVHAEPVMLPQGQEGLDLLASITMDLVDADGTVLAPGRSSNLLGHPINVVRWLRDSLKDEGQRLEPGHLLSLGSMTAIFPAEAGQTIAGRYRGLGIADSVDVVVTFR